MLALSLLVCAVGVAIAVAVLPLLDALDQREALAEANRRQDLLRQQAQAGRLAPLSAAELMIAADTPGRVGAELQLSVGEMALASGCAIRSMNVLPSQVAGPVTQTTLEVGLTGDTAALQALLHRIETSLPLLIIDDVTIRAVPAQASATMLDVTMKVRGFSAVEVSP